MNFFQAIKSCLVHYCSFRGRSPRSEYWYWNLFCFLIGVGLGIYEAVKYGPSPCALKDFECLMHVHTATIIVKLILFLPSLGVSVRRMHDVGRSGWWLLTILPPIYFIFVKSKPGPNRYGPYPLKDEMPAP
jgi:uncharacterized membrane protein YhaH (DUF805 family)